MWFSWMPRYTRLPHPYKIKHDDLKRVCMLGWQMIKNEHNESYRFYTHDTYVVTDLIWFLLYFFRERGWFLVLKYASNGFDNDRLLN